MYLTFLSLNILHRLNLLSIIQKKREGVNHYFPEIVQFSVTCVIWDFVIALIGLCRQCIVKYLYLINSISYQLTNETA